MFGKISSLPSQVFSPARRILFESSPIYYLFGNTAARDLCLECQEEPEGNEDPSKVSAIVVVSTRSQMNIYSKGQGITSRLWRFEECIENSNGKTRKQVARNRLKQ